MEKDNIKENQDIKKENIEAFKTILGDDGNKAENKKSCINYISANTLDQLIIVAFSAILLLLSDTVLKLFGYMFVKEAGVLLLAGGIFYFILNCIYEPIMEKTNLKNTIGKKILNVN